MPVPEHVGPFIGFADSIENRSSTAAPVVQPRKSHACISAQLLDPAAAYEPLGHEAHKVNVVPPSTARAVPEGQLKQAELPISVEYWPAGQTVQLKRPTLEYRPKAHEAHEAKEMPPSESEAVPAGQVEQADAPVLAWYVPPSQLEHNVPVE